MVGGKTEKSLDFNPRRDEAVYVLRNVAAEVESNMHA